MTGHGSFYAPFDAGPLEEHKAVSTEIQGRLGLMFNWTSHPLHTDWCCTPEMALAICAARVCSKRIDFTLLELETNLNLIEKRPFLGELHLIVPNHFIWVDPFTS